MSRGATYDTEPSATHPSAWIVTLESDSPAKQHIATFFGADAEEKAKEYADWKNRPRTGREWL